MAGLRRQGESRAALLILGLCAWGLQGHGCAAASQRRVLPNAHEMSVEEPDGGASHYFFTEITNEVQWDDPGGVVHCLQGAATPHLHVSESPACTASAGAHASMALRQCLRSPIVQRCRAKCQLTLSPRASVCMPAKSAAALPAACFEPWRGVCAVHFQAHWFHSRRTPPALHRDIQGKSQAKGVRAPGSLLPWHMAPPDGPTWGQTCRTWTTAAPSTGSAGTGSTSTRTPGTPLRHLWAAQPDGPRAEPPPALPLLLRALRVRAAA
jgi:hypothetical protein